MWLLWLVFSLVGLNFFLAHILKEERERKDKIIALLAGIFWLGFGGVFMWLTRPWWQPLWFNVFYMNPTFWVGTILIAVVTGFIYWLRRKVTTARRTGWYVGTGISVWLILLIVLGVLGSPITKVKLYQSIAPSVQQIAALPETTQVRFLPLEIAHRYAENKIQESEVAIGDIDPIFFKDEFSWVAVRVPNGFWRSLSFNADGFALIRSNGDVEMIRQSMKYGEGMYITDNIVWKLREKKYWVDITAIYYFQYGKEVIGIAPYLSFRYQFPVMVPYWGGVLIFHSDGTIEDLSPTQAQALSYTKGQPLFPEKLARHYVAAWAYKNGIKNAWFVHKDQVEIPNIEYTANQMPFLLPTPEGPQWMVITTPFGGKGIFKIFFIDAHNGVVKLYEPPKESSWIGPNAIWDYIKTALPMYNWYRRTGEESTGNILAIEPRPINKEGKLYWMTSITNTQYGGVSETVLVDSQKPDRILTFKTEGELKEFLTGKRYIGPTEIPSAPTGKIIPPEVQEQLHTIINQLQQLERELERLREMLK